jgi:AcrR family transcriptional regulator
MSSPTTADGGTGLRADAARNRMQIVAAARRIFAERGLNVPLEEIARQARVGVATLYRRFPTRTELIAAVFADKMAAYADAVDQALADPDPWHGFRGYLERVCQMQADDRGFADVLTLTFPTARPLQAERDRAYHRFVELVDRVKATGKLRADFVPEDQILLLMATGGVINATTDAAPDAWKRLLGYLTQAFTAPAGGLPEPPSPRQMYRALLRLQSSADSPD